MKITVDLIDTYVSPEDNKQYDKDPLLNMDSLLLSGKTRMEFMDLYERTYEFDQPGQVSLWAKDLSDQCHRIESNITRIIHRIWNGDYSVFHNRMQSPNIITALIFDSVVAANQLIKIYPYLYQDEGYEHPEIVEKLKTIVDRYYVTYNEEIRNPLTVLGGERAAEMITPHLNLLTFNPVLDQLPKYSTEFTPYANLSADLGIIYMPAFTYGVAVGNVLRHGLQLLQYLYIGDSKFLQVNKKDLKEKLSCILHALDSISLEIVFFRPLCYSVSSLPEFTTDLHRNNLDWDPEIHSKWLDLAIPLCNLTTPTTVIHTTAC